MLDLGAISVRTLLTGRVPVQGGAHTPQKCTHHNPPSYQTARSFTHKVQG